MIIVLRQTINTRVASWLIDAYRRPCEPGIIDTECKRLRNRVETKWHMFYFVLYAPYQAHVDFKDSENRSPFLAVRDDPKSIYCQTRSAPATNRRGCF